MSGTTRQRSNGAPSGGNEPADPVTIIRLLERFNVQADHFVATAGHSHHLNRSDLRALSAIRAARVEGTTATPTALAATLNLSSPATSALLDRLGRSGHLIRRRGTTDGRRVELELTDSAVDLSIELFAPLRAHLVQEIASFSEQERTTIARFLAAVTTATEQARQDQAGS